jgi:hypothetical protein
MNFLSCQPGAEKEKVEFVIDLPDTSITHRPDIVYDITQQLAKGLALNKLENGCDSFELRLWANCSVTNGGQVFVIKKTDSTWTCLNYFYVRSSKQYQKYYSKPWITRYTVDSFWVKQRHPKTSWENFFKSIQEQNIYELRAQREIKGWKNIVTDGKEFEIEYATRNLYRFYDYHCPDIYEDTFIECRQMTNILDIFNKEFGLTIGWEEMGEHPFRCGSKNGPSISL